MIRLVKVKKNSNKLLLFDQIEQQYCITFDQVIVYFV